jgi:hypothetical protein
MDFPPTGLARCTTDPRACKGRDAPPAPSRRGTNPLPTPHAPSLSRQPTRRCCESRHPLEGSRCYLASLGIAGHVRRTPRISCEAVPAVPRLRGHEAAPLVWYPRNQPGAAESLVCFMRLFGSVANDFDGLLLPFCRSTMHLAHFSEATPVVLLARHRSEPSAPRDTRALE